ncbi:MAG TPA: ATPase domain-containing protein [Thermoplasmata archaeon]
MSSALPTYVRGLDAALGGGIPRKHTVLVLGGPGTMKTALTYSILYHNQRRGIPCLYVSLEEATESITEAMAAMGMPEEVQGNSRGPDILDLGRLRLEVDKAGSSGNWLTILRKLLREGVDGNRYEALVLDSLEALLAFVNPSKPREEVFQLFGFLRDLGTTNFVISEVPLAGPSPNNYGVEFLSDGILRLTRFEIHETEVQRRLQIVKMRKVNHETGVYSLNFEDGRFFLAKAIVEAE